MHHGEHTADLLGAQGTFTDHTNHNLYRFYLAWSAGVDRSSPGHSRRYRPLCHGPHRREHLLPDLGFFILRERWLFPYEVPCSPDAPPITARRDD